MTVAAIAAPVVLVTGDGLEAREARTYPLGDYACPFCSAAVLSPAGWAESQRLNAVSYAASGEAYEIEAYPACMRQTWEARTCPNPRCLVAIPAEACARIRAEREARDAEAAARKRNHELAMQRIAEQKTAQHAACDAARDKCAEHGYCFRCWSHSTFAGLSDSRVRWVRHRNPDNCPRLRTRYGI